MLTQGLIIDEPWIGYILAGRKTWEMRSRTTSKRGPIALIRKGSGMVVGTATIADCLPPLSAAVMPAYFDKHLIPQVKVQSAGYKWFTPWVLTNVQPLAHAIPYQHPAGAVTFVNLEPGVIEAIARQRNDIAPIAVPEKIRAASSRAGALDDERNVTADHLAKAERVLKDMGRRAAKVPVPSDAAVTVTRRGKKLYIKAEWDHDLPSKSYNVAGWAEAVGTFAALVAMICMLGFAIHFSLGIFSSSISAAHAFVWLVPMVVAMIIAAILGQADLLERAFSED